MKIFISHSWQDKHDAHKVADALSAAGEVWLDVRKLAPGKKIQETIDEAIGQQDLVVLLWSAKAAASQNVAAEIATALRSCVDILPCLLDDTPLRPSLESVLAIDMRDRQVGLFRLQVAVMQRLAEGANAVDANALAAIKDYDGALQYINDYRNAKGIAGDDASYWAVKAVEAANQSYASLEAWRERTGDLLGLFQTTLTRIDEAANDRPKLQAILRELLAHEHASTNEVRQLITFVETKLKGVPPAKPAAAPSFASQVESMRAQIARAPRDGDAAEMLAPYITSSVDALAHFGAVVVSSDSEGLRQLATDLLTYLRTPNDVVADTTHGILGYLDDAWLIHNAIYRAIESGLVAAPSIPIDWTTVIALDNAAVAMFAPAAQQRLGVVMTQLLNTIAVAIPSYEPALAYDESTGGGTPYIQNAQSIDDIYYANAAGGRWDFVGR